VSTLIDLTQMTVQSLFRRWIPLDPFHNVKLFSLLNIIHLFRI
jgi:hypothetical protein